jgi:hypothetical protein
MSKHLGDFDAGTVIYGKFTTFQPSTGAAFALAGTPALSVYKDSSTTESTAGITLTASFDSRTGLNHFAIDTSADGTFYAAGSFYDVVITAGTVDGVSVVGAVVASFTIRKNSALKPAVAGRALVVDAAGLADSNMVKAGPSGSGTAQTARDLGGALPAAAAGANGGLPTVDATNSVKIQAPIKKNTARVAFEFVMYDATTGAPATGLTVSATRSIDGASPASCTNAVSEVTSGGGRYKIDLSASDLNGNVVLLKFTATGARDMLITLMPLP